MIDEEKLRETVVTIFGHLKAHQENFLMLYRELGALKEALNELSDGRFQGILEKYRERLEGQSASVEDSLVSKFEDTIGKLRSGKVF